MKILFNHDDNGQQEVKKLLGFIDADIDFDMLKTDIELNTPNLIDFIGKETYKHLHDHYKTGQGDPVLDPLVKNAQLYVLLLGYLDFTENGDIIHGNNGRKIHFAENEKTPWDWQIEKDNAALKRRAYRALDLLIAGLDASEIAVWKDSEQYQEAKSLFLYSTKTFSKVFPINNSAQLYYRLVPFMADVENECILPILGQDKFDGLKEKIKGQPNAEEKLLMLYCQKITAFRVLEDQSVLLPDEMFEEAIDYKLSSNDREVYRDKRQMKFKRFADKFEKELHQIITRQNTEEYIQNPTHGIDPDKKFVNL